MNNNYILLAHLLFTATGLLSGERISIEAGHATLGLDSGEPVTFAYESREGSIRIQSIDTPEVRLEIPESAGDDLPSFIDWDPDTRIVTLKLLGETATLDKVIYLPVDSHIKLMSVQDSVFVTGIKGDIEISTVDGDIRIEGSTGSVLAEAIDGDINLSVDPSENADPVYLSTVDGNIRMEIPVGFRGDFEMATLDGNLSFDVPDRVTINQKSGKDSGWALNRMQKKRFSMNEGGRRIVLNSVDGDLSIHSR